MLLMRRDHQSIEIEQGASKASGMADITIATYQTLARGDSGRLAKFSPDQYKAIIVDEAHHSAAKSYLSILNHFDSRILSTHHRDDDLWSGGHPPASAISPAPGGSTADDPTDWPTPTLLPLVDSAPRTLDEHGKVCVPIIGFTATFSRADGLALGKIFQQIVWHAGWLDMIKAGWLCALRFTTVQLGSLFDPSQLPSSSSGDFNQNALSKMVNTEAITQLTLKTWRDKAAGESGC